MKNFRNTPPPSFAPKRRRPHIDFEQPLTVGDKLTILLVILSISSVLFVSLYFILHFFTPQQKDSLAVTEVSQSADPPVPTELNKPESTDDHLAQLVSESSEESSKESSDEISDESSKESSDEISEESSKESSDESSEESSKESSDEISDESSKENPDEISDESSKENPDESSDESSDENSDESSDENSKENSDEISDENSKENSDESSEKESTLPYFLQENTTQETDTYALHYGELILVNKQHSCVYDGIRLAALIDNADRHYALTDSSVTLHQNVIPSFDRMMDDFYDTCGRTDIMVACGFRSINTQRLLYDNEIKDIGKKEAAMWVAPPHYSEHQTGYAFDLNLNRPGSGSISYENTEPYSWINQNCYIYGFIERYPEGQEAVTGFHAESWHFRYVGIPSAYYMHQNGLTLEEYIDVLHAHTVQDPLIIYTETSAYALYYVPADDHSTTNILLPANYSYLISGDNDSGFIVTVSLTE